MRPPSCSFSAPGCPELENVLNSSRFSWRASASPAGTLLGLSVTFAPCLDQSAGAPGTSTSGRGGMRAPPYPCRSAPSHLSCVLPSDSPRSNFRLERAPPGLNSVAPATMRRRGAWRSLAGIAGGGLGALIAGALLFSIPPLAVVAAGAGGAVGYIGATTVRSAQPGGSACPHARTRNVTSCSGV